MDKRFCTECGVQGPPDARFCVVCGAKQAGGGASSGPSFSVGRFAPLLVILAVLGIGGVAVWIGTLSPKTPPATPGRGGPASASASETLPQGHPPITLPDDVKQAMRDEAARAAAAPDDLQLWNRLGDMQYRAGQVDPAYLADAAASYQHIVDRDPNNLEAIRALGNVAFDQRQPDKAVGYYERYLKAKPDDLGVQTDMATMQMAAGRADDAIRTYENVLKADPKFFQAQFNLAIAYRTSGNVEKSMAALEQARTVAPDPQTQQQVEQVLARLKNEPPAGQAGAGDAPHPPMGGVPPAQAPSGSAPAGQDAGAPAAPGGSFQADAEAVFRQNPVLGTKVQRIEWSGNEYAKVFLRDFPMDQMDEGMQAMFIDRMKTRIKAKKDAYQITQAARFELVDEPSGRVLGTITE